MGDRVTKRYTGPACANGLNASFWMGFGRLVRDQKESRTGIFSQRMGMEINFLRRPRFQKLDLGFWTALVVSQTAMEE